MKKQNKSKITAQVIRGTKHTAKAKKRIASRVVKQDQLVKSWEPGPSKVITYDKDGKVVSFNSRCKTKHEETLTEVGKAAMAANKATKQSKKTSIAQILKEAGFDPKMQYTKSEKKKFTRIVKAKLLVQPIPVTLTKEQCKERFIAQEATKKQLFEARLYQSPFGQKKIQKGFTAAELAVKEKKDDRTFQYVVRRKSEKDPTKNLDFLTDYVNASTREEAKAKLKSMAKKYSKDEAFSGIRLRDSKDNNMFYYSKEQLLAA